MIHVSTSCLSPAKGQRTQKRKIVETIIETSKALSVTERRVRSDGIGVTPRRSEEA